MSNLKEICSDGSSQGSGAVGGVAWGGAMKALMDIEAKIKDNTYSVVSKMG